jgi:hypothetical protein
MAGDPLFVVGFRASGDRWCFAVGGDAGVDLLLLHRATGTLLLLGEVWDDPDGVEEVPDAGSTG